MHKTFLGGKPTESEVSKNSLISKSKVVVVSIPHLLEPQGILTNLDLPFSLMYNLCSEFTLSASVSLEVVVLKLMTLMQSV